MFSCESGHVFAENELSMPTDHDNHDHTSGRCPVCESRDVFEIEGGVLQTIDGDGIMHDYDPVNRLLQREERVSR